MAPKLQIYNSLGKAKQPFVPLDPDGRKVGWYACGPTVYDDSHLGHARTYVTTDIIRRVMTDYMGYDVKFVMNITDVDDKIILAARQQHLYARWLAKFKEVNAEVKDTTKQAFDAYLRKNLPLMPHDTTSDNFVEESEKAYGHVIKPQPNGGQEKPQAEKDKEAKVKMHLNTSRSAAEAQQLSSPSMEQFSAKASGILLPYIDSRESMTIKGSEHEIFTKLTKRYEQRFFEDMQALNVRYPDVVTRVTEYGPQIVDFVKRIQDNGFAYEHEGSVYYDIAAWEASGGVYARLCPSNRNDEELQADGEGSLATKKTGFKRSAGDFALWKASRPGEPSWPSPWGEGRPGWHIECSAMASDILGSRFDMHSGGIDLAFPHHDNELAQSEAHYCIGGKGSDSKGWVNYFLHTGHLHIHGSKMSKSLKNFTTIREALNSGGWTSRGLRIVLLLGSWDSGIEIEPGMIKAALSWEERVTNLFVIVRDLQERNVSEGNGQPDRSSTSNGETTDLSKSLQTAKIAFRDSLTDSFNTASAMNAISSLINEFHSQKQVPFWTTLEIARWVSEMVYMFGLDSEKPREGQIGWSGIDIPDQAKPFIYPLAQLREKVRQQAIKKQIDLSALGRMEDKDTTYSANQIYANANADFQRKIVHLHKQDAAPKEYLAACDHLRDTVLWNLGIYLEDREDQPPLVRPLSASLRQERQEREAKAADKAASAAKKESAKAAQEAADREKLEKGKLNPAEMFRTSEYSEWDDDGLPTKDAEGNGITKSRGKTLKKQWDAQKKLHEKYKASAGQT